MPSFTRHAALKRGADRAGRMARKTNRYPLRRIVREEGSQEQLECGHVIYPPTVWFGRAVSPARRRRCQKCAELLGRQP